MIERVRLEAIEKSFPGVKALDGVGFSVHSGEIVALVGENGAGKSTLMKILSGIYPAGTYTGRIYVDGVETSFANPLAADRAGLAIIHQELSSFAHLSVAENLFIGHWPTKPGGVVDWNKIQSETRRLLARVGAQFEPDCRMGDLSVGAQQLVEIAKALSRDSRVLILDEPTSALTDRETRALFKLLKDLRKEGRGLVYISHKMEEIFELADRVVVLRDGKSVWTAPRADLTERELVRHMVGRELNRAFPAFPDRKLGEPVLSADQFRGPGFGPVTFSLKRGEILGFAGLLGAGRTELMRAILGHGADQCSGVILRGSAQVSYRNIQESLKNKIVMVCEDRKRESNLTGRSLTENVTLARHSLGSQTARVSPSADGVRSIERLRRLGTRYAFADQCIDQLSGGNQQKVILGRALEVDPEILILDEPTRGVDVGAKYEIYEILFALAKEGKSLLVVSSDLPELIGICDRILALNQGAVCGEFERARFSRTEIMASIVSIPTKESHEVR